MGNLPCPMCKKGGKCWQLEWKKHKDTKIALCLLSFYSENKLGAVDVPAPGRRVEGNP
jgi:hypothetical protein